jgi:hypothetical protein
LEEKLLVGGDGDRGAGEVDGWGDEGGGKRGEESIVGGGGLP